MFHWKSIYAQSIVSQAWRAQQCLLITSNRPVTTRSNSMHKTEMIEMLRGAFPEARAIKMKGSLAGK